MRARRVLLLLQTLAVVITQILNVANANLWNGFHVDKDDENKDKDQHRKKYEETDGYGVDVSYPIHHRSVSTNYAWLPHNVDPTAATPRKYAGMPVNPLGDRQSFHDSYMKGCRDKFGVIQGLLCSGNDMDRIHMNLHQPASMQNYTEIGFAKINISSSELFAAILSFWEKNKDNGKLEEWGVGNIYTNNWESRSDMISVGDGSLRGGGNKLQDLIWAHAKKVISEWTGQELTATSLYGIRVYKDGAVLAPHVDRLPLVSSAIINVAQDLDEPWPLEVYGHDGKAANVTMEPGDMVLYESHSVIHGRPFPMKGRFMANLFVHFEPTGHTIRHNIQLDEESNVDKKYRRTAEQGVGGHESDNSGVPPYIKPGTPEEADWRRKHSIFRKFATGSISVHDAAKEGDVVVVQAHIQKKKDVVNERDENGWTPLHEGARGGHLEVVKLLVENGADLTARTGMDEGGTALWWAKQSNGEDSEVVKFLEEIGALDVGPEL